MYYFGLNMRNPALSNPKVVEAIKYLVDYQGIADTIGKGTIKVHQNMIPMVSSAAMSTTTPTRSMSRRPSS